MERLENMRQDGVHNLLNKVSLFCEKKNIFIVNIYNAYMLQ